MVPFTTLRAFNQSELRPLASYRGRVDERAASVFASDSLVDRLVRALAARRAIAVKEVAESFEFFGRTRRRLRAPRMVDLGAGHGLAGILFAVFEPVVAEVLLVDRRQPACHRAVLAAAVAVAPWIADKVRYFEMSLRAAEADPPAVDAVLAVHNCGKRTDRAIAIAIAQEARLAAMPCCYGHTTPPGLAALERALGARTATDIDRTYRLLGAGYEVDWAFIPEAITPMNRILVACPRGRPESSGPGARRQAAAA